MRWLSGVVWLCCLHNKCKAHRNAKTPLTCGLIPNRIDPSPATRYGTPKQVLCELYKVQKLLEIQFRRARECASYIYYTVGRAAMWYAGAVFFSPTIRTDTYYQPASGLRRTLYIYRTCVCYLRYRHCKIRNKKTTPYHYFVERWRKTIFLMKNIFLFTPSYCRPRAWALECHGCGFFVPERWWRRMCCSVLLFSSIFVYDFPLSSMCCWCQWLM